MPANNLALVKFIPAPKRGRGRPSHTAPSELFETRREEILQAARLVFARDGYASASLDDVAREGGLSKASLYYYFPSKAHLFFELASFYADEQIVKLAEISQEPDPKTCLIELMRHQVLQVTGEMDFYRYFFDTRPSLTDKNLKAQFSKKLALYSDYFYKSIRRAIAAGLLPPIDEYIATQAIFGATFWIYKWYDPKRFDAETVLSQFLTMIGINA